MANQKKDNGEKKASAPKGHSLGSVNLDSLKNVLHKLASTMTFQDENSKRDFEYAVNNLHASGDPAEKKAKEEEKAAKAES